MPRRLCCPGRGPRVVWEWTVYPRPAPGKRVCWQESRSRALLRRLPATLLPGPHSLGLAFLPRPKVSTPEELQCGMETCS